MARLEWRLPARLAARGMHAGDLADKLDLIGCELSISGCHRLVSATPRCIRWTLLESLTVALDCVLADLITEAPTSPGQMPPPAKLPAVRRSHAIGRLEWRLPAYLVRRNMKAMDLADAFIAAGRSLSLSRCYCLINAAPQFVRWSLLEDLTSALDCVLADVIAEAGPPPLSPSTLTMPPPVQLLEAQRHR